MKQRQPYERTLRGKRVWYVLWNHGPDSVNDPGGGRKQTWLGRYEDEAHENFERLKRNELILRPEKVMRGDPLTILEAATAFLEDIRTDRAKKPATYKWYKRFLDTLCEFKLSESRGTVGGLRFTDLRKDHVKRWIAAHPDWNDNTAHCAARAATALCNWLVKSDAERFAAIKESPLKGFVKAPTSPRDCDLTPDEWKRLIGSQLVDDDLRDAVLFMRLTGCRPEEMRHIEKRHFDPSVPAIIYPPSEWKCGRKGKVPKDRVIRLPGEALVIVQKRCLKYPTGPIFRGKGDVPMKKDALARRFSRLSDKLNIPHLVPYSVRHTYATDMAFKVDCLILAELMGTSVEMLAGVYAKARKRMDLMAQAAAKVTEGIAV